MMYVVSFLIYLIGAALIVFGLHGCATHGIMHGWAVFAGFLLVTTYHNPRKL